MSSARTTASTTDYSESIPGAALHEILCTEELAGRPSRPPDPDREQVWLERLVRGLGTSPETVLQSLADTILHALRCDSAGVSLVNEQETRFYWPAIAGVWKPHIAKGTPRHFGPCGDVLERDCPLLFRHFERRYTYFMPVVPACSECLLVPFYVPRGPAPKAVGTIWAILHDPPHDENSRDRPQAWGEPGQFDGEDLRILESLGEFATLAYQVWTEAVPRAERPGETRPA